MTHFEFIIEKAGRRNPGFVVAAFVSNVDLPLKGGWNKRLGNARLTMAA
jgi:hypothetical protein